VEIYFNNFLTQLVLKIFLCFIVLLAQMSSPFKENDLLFLLQIPGH